MMINKSYKLAPFPADQFQGRIQEFSIAEAPTPFKKKSGGAWVPTQSQARCL